MKKRILLSLVSFFMMTSMWASLTEAYQIYVTAGANGKTGAEATLTLNLKNQNAIAIWTCDVVLPEGITYVDGSVAVVPNRFPEGYNPEITATVNEDGTVTFACSGETGVAISNTDGAVATFDVAIASDVEPGDYTIVVKNATMIEVDTSTHSYKDKECDPWTIEEGAVALKGDVNEDGELDIADAVSVLNAMASGAGAGSLADVNGDGEVDIADFVTVLNLMAEL